MYLKNSKKGFTFIELLISMTIISILLIMTYAPYAYYQNKAKVKISLRSISQDIYAARNMAINGIDRKIDNDINMSVGLLIETGKNKKIKYVLYPYNLNVSEIPLKNSEKGFTVDEKNDKNISIFKEETLPEFVEISGLPNDNKTLFFGFSSIYGKGKLFTINSDGKLESLYSDTFSEPDDNKVTIKIGFKGKTEGPLSDEIIYNTKTYITDY